MDWSLRKKRKSRKTVRVRATRPWATQLLAVLLLVMTLLSLAVGWAYLRYNGVRLARRVGALISPAIHGRVEVTRISWSARALWDLVFGTATPVEIEGVHIYDPVGTEVIHVPRLRAEIKLWPLIARNEVEVPEVDIYGGYCRLTEMPGRVARQSLGLAATFMPYHPPGEKRVEVPDAEVKGMPLLNFSSIHVRGTRFLMQIGPTGFDIPDVHVDATMRIRGYVPRDGMQLDGTARAAKGWWIQNGFRVPIADFSARKAGIYGHALRVQGARLKLAGAPTRVDGSLPHLFAEETGIDARAVVAQAGTAAKRLMKLSVDGPALVDIHAHGDVVQPQVDAHFREFAARTSGLQLQGIHGRATMHVATGRLEVPRIEARLLDGKLEGDAQLNADLGTWKASIRAFGIDPKTLAPALGGQLGGKIVLTGQVGSALSGRAQVQLRLARRRRRRNDPIPRNLAVRGRLQINPQILDLSDVTLSGGGNKVHARGSINLESLRSNLKLVLDLRRAGQWLERLFDYQPVRAVSGKLRLTGVYPHLAIAGNVTAHDVGIADHRVPQLRAHISLNDGTLSLSDLRGAGYGGQISGEGSLQLFAGDVSHPLRRPTLQARVGAAAVTLRSLGLGAYATGKLWGHAELHGPLDELRGLATLRAPRLRYQGDTYRNLRLRVGLLPDRVSIHEAKVRREAGGSLSVRGDFFHDGQLDFDVRPRGFPLAAIPGTDALDLAGLLTGGLALTGTLADPRLAGVLQVANVRLRGALLGSGQLSFRPDVDAIRISGTLLGGIARLDGFALMRPRPSLHMTADVKDFPLHRVLPEMAKLRVGQIKGFTSGQIRFDVDSENGLTWATARLSKLAFSLRYRALGQRTARMVELGNRQDLLLTYSDKRLHVVTARLVSSVPGRNQAQAEFSLGGIVGDKTDLRARGTVPLGLAEFFLARRVRRITGAARADLRMVGSLDRPSLWGEVVITGVKVKLPKFDRLLQIPQGRLTLTPQQVQLSGLRFTVGEDQLEARGKLSLAPQHVFKPETVSLDIKGNVNMGLLQLVFPEQLSLARGAATVSLQLSGPVLDPRIAGDLVVRRQVELSPRGLGRLLTLKKGRVGFANYHVCIGGQLRCPAGAETCHSAERTCNWSTPLTGTYDEGTLRAFGEARFDRKKLVDLYLRLTGTSIPQRKPGVYAAEFNTDVTLVGDGDALALDGTIDIIDARYTRQFDIVKQAVIRPRLYEESPPFWEGIPLLENLALTLRIRSAGRLRIKNEYADLSVGAAMTVSGTLSAPALHGTVHVEEGEFRIPFLRGEYRVDRGEIVFRRNRPPEAAELDIRAEAQHMDRLGTEYQIALQLQGNLERINIRLSSQPHLEQGQILWLLATGQTTDQWRNQLARTDSGGVTASTADAPVKELTGQVFGGFIEDPIRKATGLDLVRLEVGTETVTARVCKNIGDAVAVCGEGEKAFLGDFGGKATALYKIHDYLRLMGRLERLSTTIEREQENASRGRVELKLQLPLR